MHTKASSDIAKKSPIALIGLVAAFALPTAITMSPRTPGPVEVDV